MMTQNIQIMIKLKLKKKIVSRKLSIDKQNLLNKSNSAGDLSVDRYNIKELCKTNKNFIFLIILLCATQFLWFIPMFLINLSFNKYLFHLFLNFHDLNAFLFTIIVIELI